MEPGIKKLETSRMNLEPVTWYKPGTWWNLVLRNWKLLEYEPGTCNLVLTWNLVEPGIKNLETSRRNLEPKTWNLMEPGIKNLEN